MHGKAVDRGLGEGFSRPPNIQYCSSPPGDCKTVILSTALLGYYFQEYLKTGVLST